MTIDTSSTIVEIAARLKLLSDKLQRTTNQEERRILLKQFRTLLAEADSRRTAE